MRINLWSAAIAVPCLLSFVPVQPGQPGLQPGDPINAPQLLKREPVLIYDVSGATLSGPVHESLVIYSDGLLSYARSGSSIFGDTPDEVVSTAVSQDDVRDLFNALAETGAGSLDDHVGVVADLPITTVTLLQPSSDAIAHTFSYTPTEAPYMKVSETIWNFIDEHANQ